MHYDLELYGDPAVRRRKIETEDSVVQSLSKVSCEDPSSDPVCIYCGSDVEYQRPGPRRSRLLVEGIIPAGFLRSYPSRRELVSTPSPLPVAKTTSPNTFMLDVLRDPKEVDPDCEVVKLLLTEETMRSGGVKTPTIEDIRSCRSTSPLPSSSRYTAIPSNLSDFTDTGSDCFRIVSRSPSVELLYEEVDMLE